jgi:23S rRNA U2552 (ribose-2'-O)-methylase RlmE/FtsJ
MGSKYNISNQCHDNDMNKSNFKINIKYTETPEEPCEIYGYNSSINNYRNKIDNIKNEDWKKVRWLINEYDFLVKDPIINRAFYKYWEIINEFDIYENYDSESLILHCAEAPGGFIQGTNIYLQLDRSIINEATPTQGVEIDEDGFILVKKKNIKKNKYKVYTISLNKDLPQYKMYNLPSYNKNILNKKICITYGKDNTGDINNWENIEHIKNLSKASFFLITADGGFDEGTDFNNKEQLHYCLILSEIYTAIKLQEQNGHFILKVFDIFTRTSANLLYILYLCYSEVYIYKPKTSRPTNSEKYIICKNFKKKDDLVLILDKLKNLIGSIKKSKAKYTSFTLFEEIPEHFIYQIKHINNNLLSTQCDFLYKAIILCEDKDFIKEYEMKLESCIEHRRVVFKEWEEYYNLNAYI